MGIFGKTKILGLGFFVSILSINLMAQENELTLVPNFSKPYFDPHAEIRELLDPNKSSNPLSLEMRFFPRVFKKALSENVSIEKSETKKIAFSTIAEQALVLFKDEVEYERLKTIVYGWEGGLSEEFKIDWNVFHDKIQNWDAKDKDLETFDRTFSVEEKVILFNGLHLSYLASLRTPSPDLIDDADLEVIGNLENHFKANTTLQRQFLEVDVDSRERSREMVRGFFNSWSEEKPFQDGMNAFANLKQKVFKPQLTRVFSEESDLKEMSWVESQVGQVLSGLPSPQGTEFSVPRLALINLFDRATRTQQDILPYNWMNDPDMAAIGKIMKSTSGTLDESSRRSIVKNSLQFARVQYGDDPFARIPTFAKQNAPVLIAGGVAASTAVTKLILWNRSRDLFFVKDQFLKNKQIYIDYLKANAPDSAIAAKAASAMSAQTNFAHKLEMSLRNKFGADALQKVQPLIDEKLRIGAEKSAYLEKMARTQLEVLKDSKASLSAADSALAKAWGINRKMIEKQMLVYSANTAANDAALVKQIMDLRREAYAATLAAKTSRIGKATTWLGYRASYLPQKYLTQARVTGKWLPISANGISKSLNVASWLTMIGAGTYLGVTYCQGATNEEFEAYQASKKSMPTSTDATVGADMRTHNLSQLSADFDQEFDNRFAGGLNQKRIMAGRPSLEIILNPQSMSPLSADTGFAKYAYGILKIREDAKENTAGDYSRNAQTGILVRFEQQQSAEADESLAKELGLKTGVPKKVYWTLESAVILDADALEPKFKEDVPSLIRRALFGNEQGIGRVQINPELAKRIFDGAKSQLWK
ncbi:MAG: hypothetical protein J0L93_07200 [Deltaproteobacteria bacterium]|nr:hypothetical protein [Deltaproteobacteria bacterium]